MYEVEYTSKADEDIIFYRKSGNTAQIKKIVRIIEELREHPETGIGKPEKLKHKYSGF